MNMFIRKKGHQPGVYVPLRALFLVLQREGMPRQIQDFSELTSLVLSHNIYIFNAFSLNESVILYAFHFPMKNINHAIGRTKVSAS